MIEVAFEFNVVALSSAHGEDVRSTLSELFANLESRVAYREPQKIMRVGRFIKERLAAMFQTARSGLLMELDGTQARLQGSIAFQF